jgi:leader peptidase (prepilin peptidase)/N-methyltransferase
MDITLIIFLFILGVIVGSFLNVVALRYNTGLSITNGRSVCFYCNQKIKWYNLFPIISFIFLRGKCRVCKMPISWQYPLVEFLTGVLFVGVALRQYYYWPIYSIYPNGFLYSILLFAYYCIVFSILLVISIYDIRHKIIPNKLVYSFIFLAIAKLLIFFYFFGFSYGVGSVLDFLSPIILFIPFALLWFIYYGRWIGFGDAKLALGIGALLGLSLGLSSIILAFWVGALWSIILLVLDRLAKNKNISMKTEVPFAPFMILAVFIAFFTHIDVLGLNNIIYYFQ